MFGWLGLLPSVLDKMFHPTPLNLTSEIISIQNMHILENFNLIKLILRVK